MEGTEEGFVTGGKDGIVRVWDTDFKPITKSNIAQSSEGYEGIKVKHML